MHHKVPKFIIKLSGADLAKARYIKVIGELETEHTGTDDFRKHYKIEKILAEKLLKNRRSASPLQDYFFELVNERDNVENNHLMTFNI